MTMTTDDKTKALADLRSDLQYLEQADAHSDEGPLGEPAARSILKMALRYANLAAGYARKCCMGMASDAECECYQAEQHHRSDARNAALEEVTSEMIAAGSQAIDDYYDGTKDAPFEGSVEACYRAMRALASTPQEAQPELRGATMPDTPKQITERIKQITERIEALAKDTREDSYPYTGWPSYKPAQPVPVPPNVAKVVAEIDALDADRTPGPWRQHDMERNTAVSGKPGGEVFNTCNGFGDQDANFWFIVKLVNAWPAIRAALTRPAQPDLAGPIDGVDDLMICREALAMSRNRADKLAEALCAAFSSIESNDPDEAYIILRNALALCDAAKAGERQIAGETKCQTK